MAIDDLMKMLGNSEMPGISPEVVERLKTNRRMVLLVNGAVSEALRQVHTGTGLGAYVNDVASLLMDSSFHEELSLSAAESMSLRMSVKTVMPQLEKIAADSTSKLENKNG